MRTRFTGAVELRLGQVSSGQNRESSASTPRFVCAFSLLEVLIALAIFFMAIFAILQSVSQSLAAARLLQQKQQMPDVSSLVADLYLTNKFEEGVIEGDFGDAYPGFTWTRETYLYATNGLFQVDFSIQGIMGRQPIETKSSVWMWRPDSQVSSFGRRL